MALHINKQMTSSRRMEGKDERTKSSFRGNIRKPKKLLSDRFGSISNITTELGNREGDPCGTGVYPLNQELMDFEKGVLKRKYDNLKVSVNLEGKDHCLVAPGFTHKKPHTSHSPFCDKNDLGSALNNERSKIEPSLNESSRKIGEKDRHLAGDNVRFSQGSTNAGNRDETIGRKGSYNNVANNSVPLTNAKLVNNTSEAPKRPFFYAEQNSVPPKKRFNIDHELQQNSHAEYKSKEDAITNKPSGYHSSLQQGESTPSSIASEHYGSDTLMLFEGRTLLKGGVKPRHIPKTVVERDDKGLPTDPRLQRQDYCMLNHIMEYKVLLWHKDWLFDYTKKLIETRKSNQMKREQERLNACAKKEASDEHFENEKVVESKDTTCINKEPHDTKNSSSLILESKNVDTLKSVAHNLVKNVRSSSVGAMQCFEYEHSRSKKEVVPNVYDPRLKNRSRKQMETSESHGRVNTFESSALRKNSEKKDLKFHKYDAKQKYQKKKSPDGVQFSRGKTGAVLREDSRCNSPSFSAGDKEFKTLSTNSMHSNYYNKNLSPIYQDTQNYNSYQRHLPKTCRGSTDVNPKGKDRGLEIYPQFCQDNWY